MYLAVVRNAQMASKREENKNKVSKIYSKMYLGC